MPTTRSQGPQGNSSSSSTRPTSPPALRKNKPLSPLSQEMRADLQLEGLAERTRESCLRNVRSVAAGRNDRKLARMTERMNRTIMRDEERCAPTSQNMSEPPINMLALEPIDYALSAATSRSNDSWLSERQTVDVQRGQSALQTSGPKEANPLSKPRTRLTDRVLEIRAHVIPLRTHDLTSLRPPRAS